MHNSEQVCFHFEKCLLIVNQYRKLLGRAIPIFQVEGDRFGKYFIYIYIPIKSYLLREKNVLVFFLQLSLFCFRMTYISEANQQRITFEYVTLLPNDIRILRSPLFTIIWFIALVKTNKI